MQCLRSCVNATRPGHLCNQWGGTVKTQFCKDLKKRHYEVEIMWRKWMTPQLPKILFYYRPKT